jgi:error-prone DNA polymerase
MQARGFTAEFAAQVFQQIRGFGEYGFPESHAASFALLVYVSAWLKHYYPAVFAAALINSQPMGFYAPAQLLRDLREHGGTVLPVDVNSSHWDCTLESPSGDVRGTVPALRLGLRMVTGLPRREADKLIAARAAGPFRSISEVARRSGLSAATLSRLAGADAFGSLGCSRRTAIWDALAQSPDRAAQPLFAQLDDDDERPAPLPEMPPLEEVLADYRATSLSLKAHPLSFYRRALRSLKVLAAAQLPRIANHRWVRVAGLVLLRQRPGTAKGITFVTLEDETGTINLVVRQQIWDRYHHVSRCSSAWIAEGQLQTKDSVIHVVVHKLEDMAEALQDGDLLRNSDPVGRIQRNFH